MNNNDLVLINRRLQMIDEGTHPLMQKIIARTNSAAQRTRQIEQLYEQTKLHNQQITALLEKMQVGGGTHMHPLTAESDRVQYIEQIPGRRIPYDYLCEIPVDEGVTTQQERAISISNYGPFVARARVISFVSFYRFSVTDEETGATADFSGRSYGRFRAPHSAQDFMDGHLAPVQQFGGAAPGTGNALWPSPLVHSPYRTMQPDARITVQSESDGFPRSNIAVPSAFWTTNINAPFALPALDFFSRNESISIKLTPLHVNNPAAGNLTGLPGVAPYPFAGQEYDHHEGVVDPFTQDITTDPVTRLPRGTFICGFAGYRIMQAPAALGGIS